MRFLLMLLVARAAFISADPTGEKKEIEEAEPPPLPEVPDVDIFGSGVITDCGWASTLLPSCPDDLGCGDDPPCPEGQICSFQDKELKCRDEKLCTGQLDICFILDESGSVGRSNFAVMVDFVKNLIGTSNLGEDRVKTSAVLFSSRGRQEILWGLGDIAATDAAAADSILDSAANAYSGGSTCIWCGLQKCREVFATGPNRPFAQDVVILLTDGRNNQNGGSVTGEADNLKNDGAIIEVVGIGSSLNIPQLNQVSSRGSIFNAANFGDLQNIIDDLLAAACA